MFYYLFSYLDKYYDLPGAGVFEFISFRAAMTIIASLVITLLLGNKVIRLLQRLQIGEEIRDLGLEGQIQKKGTPTMGGILIIAGILIPTLLFAKLHNVYVFLMIVSTIWLGTIGFIDDYIKVFKKNKKGLHGKFKIIGQVGLGLIVGIVLYFNDNVVIMEKVCEEENLVVETAKQDSLYYQGKYTKTFVDCNWVESKSTKTNIPFFKDNEFDYSVLISWISEGAKKYTWLIFIPIVIFIITAVSNGANLTDGLDGLATGVSAIIGATLGILAYVSGNSIFSDYLNIMYIPYSGEMVVFVSAFVGACVGFLWYNSYPARVFMGDTGSLALGGIIAVFAIVIRKELLIPILCGVFFVESLSVMLQVAYFKYTKKKYGEGRRIFKMAPLHHHYQKKNFHESKIVIRFWIVAIALAILTIVTLKLR